MLRLAISIARLAANRNRRLVVATRDFIDRLRDIVAIEFEGQSDSGRDEKVLTLHRIGVGMYSADTGDGELTIRTYSETDPTITVTGAPATGKERGE